MKRIILLAFALLMPAFALAAQPAPQAQEASSSGAMQQAGSAAANGQYADIDGVRIHYTVSGSGMPLLLIHGYPLNGNLFVHQREALSREFKVITPDLPGFGKSQASSANASLATYAKAMFGLMDKLDIKKAIIGGHSMGGMTTIEMYKEQPDRFAGMILIDTAAMAAPLPLKNEWMGYAELGKQPDHKMKMNQLLVPAMLSFDARTHDKQLVSYVKDMVNAASVEGIEGGGRALADRPDNSAVLKNVKVPALILVGSADPVTPAEVSQKMHAAIPGSTLDIVMGGSHAEILEKYQKADQDILQWAQASHLETSH